MIFELRKDGSGVVTAEGVMGAGMAASFRKALLKALETAEKVELDLGAAEAIDLLNLQLICSAKRTASELGKELTLAAPHGALDRAELDAGFSKIEQCG